MLRRQSDCLGFANHALLLVVAKVQRQKSGKLKRIRKKTGEDEGKDQYGAPEGLTAEEALKHKLFGGYEGTSTHSETNSSRYAADRPR